MGTSGRNFWALSIPVWEGQARWYCWTSCLQLYIGAFGTSLTSRSWQTSSRDTMRLTESTHLAWHEHHPLTHSKEALDLNYMLDHMDLTDIQKFYPTAPEYTFFSYEHGPFSKIDHSTKQVWINFKKLEMWSAFFSDHNGMKLKLNYKKKTGKFTHMWRLNHMLLNNQWIKEEIKRAI